MAEAWGIDIGGTKLEGVVIRDGQHQNPLCRIRIDTEADRGYRHIVGRLSELVTRMRQETGLVPQRIGFGTPGISDPKLQTMKNCNTTCLNGMPLHKDLEDTLGVKAVFANDANCFALAETLLGAARGARNVFGVIMGTGVGGGVVIDGRVVNGLQGIAGEWGHNVLDVAGTPCYCGKSGCVETVISGVALERFYQAQSGSARKLADITERAHGGADPVAMATMKRLVESFARAIAVIINIVDPEVIVLGGGVSNVESLYSEGRELAARYVFNNRLETKIVRNALGDSAGVFGAAMLVASD